MQDFITTENIFKNGPLYSEYHPTTGFFIYPPTYNWDYKRELKIEDIEIWEVITNIPLHWGVYAAWCPYAEFYMIVPGLYNLSNFPNIETFYGKSAEKKLIEKMKNFNIPYKINKKWVENYDMWLYD